MVKFYVRRILVDKKMTIDEVPMRWRAKVQEEIEKQRFSVMTFSVETCDRKMLKSCILQ